MESTQPSLPPDTTAQQDVVTAGQRKINLIWEYTQAFIATAVVLTTMAAGLRSAFAAQTREIPTILATAFGMVVGAYFQRTNHTKIGGVGDKPGQPPYEGR